MNKLKLLLFTVVLLQMNVYAQTPTIDWQKCLGGSGSDGANRAITTNDGGYIVSGSSNSNDGDLSLNNGSTDMWVVKTSNTGMIQWQKNYGGSAEDRALYITATNDGGYILAGSTNSTDGNVSGLHGTNYSDVWIVKISDDGAIQWQKCYGGSKDDWSECIQQTTDGGYIIAGTTQSNDGDISGLHSNFSTDGWLIKISSDGNLEWQKCLGGTNSDEIYSVEQTSDNGYIVCGQTYSNDGDVSGNHSTFTTDSWVAKLSDSGLIQWQKCLGGSNYENAREITQTSDGGYILAGSAFSNNGDVSGNHGGSNYADIWVVKLSNSGVIQWQKCIGGSLHEGAERILELPDGSYLVTGFSDSANGNMTMNHGNSDASITKISNSGAILWQKSMGGTQDDFADGLALTLDGGCLFVGSTRSNDGDVTGNHSNIEYDLWMVKLSGTLSDFTPNPITNQPIILPNPTKSIIKIELPNSLIVNNFQISDLMGKLLKSSQNTNEIDVSDLATGVYIAEISSGFTTWKAKFVKK